MKFSIIVPVYNTEQYLPKCIESILNQENSDLELLLVVDGSPDASLSICEAYKKTDYRVTVINKENGGSTSCRKAAANVAKGDYVICIDSDDYVDSDYLRYTTSIIEEYTPDIISFGLTTHDHGKNYTILDPVEEGIYQNEKCESIKKGFLYDCRMNGLNNGTLNYSLCRKAIRREVFVAAQNKVDSKIIIGEDMLCTAFALESTDSIFISNKSFYHYIIHDESITRRNPLSNAPHFYNTIQELNKIHFLEAQQIAVYAFNAITNILMCHVKMSKTYREFLSGLMTAPGYQELYDIANTINWRKGNHKEKVFAVLIKGKCYGLIYYLCKMRG